MEMFYLMHDDSEDFDQTRRQLIWGVLDHTVWFTRPEWPKGAKDVVKHDWRPKAGPKGHQLKVGAGRALE